MGMRRGPSCELVGAMSDAAYDLLRRQRAKKFSAAAMRGAKFIAEDVRVCVARRIGTNG